MTRKGRWPVAAIVVAGVAALALYRVSRGSERSLDDFQRSPLQVAEGFTVELVAGPPLVDYPVMAGFDERGRLFVAENAGVNLADEDLLKQLPSEVRRLEDTDGDGVFDESTVFADKMTFPQGALWHEGSLYVASPPSMWRLQDSDGDGVADVREEVATGFDFTGNAADIHGPFLHPAGRLFWCHGRKGHEVYEGDRLVSKATGARIWTARPDGSDLQVFAGGGMDNPTELAFTDEGDVLGTVNIFLSNPRADAIVHWVHGGVYPRTDREQVLAEFRRTGDLLPPAVDLGHVAPAGVLRYRSGQFGAAYRDNLFLAEFNAQRIMRIVLERDGSSFSGHTEVFVSSSSPDVHFTDLVEDADGSLLLIDTGGWFTQGCPTSGVAKPNVQGAIYRVRKIDAPAVSDPRGLEEDWADAPVAELTRLLDDDRFAVRDRAVSELARRGDAAVPALEAALADGSRRARLQAVWTLTRIESEPARDAIRRALDDDDAGVRQAACQSISITRDKAASARLTALLRDEAAAVRREAAAALGRLHAAGAVDGLLAAVAATGEDPLLQHALTYALIEIDQPQTTAQGLSSANPAVKRAALMALSEMESGRLSAGQVLPMLDSDVPELRRAALMVVEKRDEWREPVAALLGRWLEGPALPPGRHEAASDLLVAFGTQPVVRELIGRLLMRPSLPSERRQLVLQAIAQIPGGTLHSTWIPPLKRLLRSSDDADAVMVTEVIRPSKSKSFDAELERIGNDSARDPLVRVAALQAISGKTGPIAEPAFELLATLFHSGDSVPVRVQSAEMLAGAILSAQQVSRLAPLIGDAGPMELKALMPAFEQTSNAAVGSALIRALSKSPALFSLNAGYIRRSFSDYPEPVVAEAEALVAKLVQRDREKESHLAEFQAAAADGDPERGRQVFVSGKGSCIVCHRVGDSGGEIGPNLSTIGRSRSAQQLLDAIVYPTESGFARGYEAYNVSTRDGKTYMGTIPRETPDTIYVTSVTGEPVAVPRDQIQTMEPSPMSLMPSGLERLLSRQELGDLVAYLHSLN
ncbi:MAG: c-type cytochrome [Luteitalea sp.]|nr:c-type cytochrome [Luteitalea sp.]